jgi:hypothetical protein
VAGLQLRVRFVPAALLAMLRTALALQCVSKARDWTGHVDRWRLSAHAIRRVASVREEEPVALRSKGGRARRTHRGPMPYQPGTKRCK